MPRYRLDIEYCGTPYHGWQRQDGPVSVQQAIEEAIETFANEPIRLHAAGRTDTGVHAMGQVAHVDLTRDWDGETVLRATNAALLRADDAISIRTATRVAEGFHARFSATARHYQYRILARDWPPALGRDETWWVPAREPLEVGAMAEAAQRLLGRHDFTTFRAAQCQADSPVRTLDRFEVEAIGTAIMFHVTARSFLHHQVRSMVGALKRVGERKWTPDDVTDALAARDRSRCPGMAPARGLYLMAVDYPDDAE